MNPYFKHFCGDTVFQNSLPLDTSSLARWSKRLGEEGVDWFLTKTIEAGREAEVVIVETTVIEKARRRLVTLAQEVGLSLRQSLARLGPRLSGPVARYAHARQFKRNRKARPRLKGYTGRVMRGL